MRERRVDNSVCKRDACYLMEYLFVCILLIIKDMFESILNRV